MQQVIDEEYFYVDENGNYWIEGLGKNILITAMYEYLEDEVEYKGKKLSRDKIIEEYAKELEDMFLNFSSKVKIKKD